MVHCGKAGVEEDWSLSVTSVVLIANECFTNNELKKPDAVWRSLLTACVDVWLRSQGMKCSDRRCWLATHLEMVHRGVVALEEGWDLDWWKLCRSWQWKWPSEIDD